MNSKEKIPLVELDVLSKITKDFLMGEDDFSFGNQFDKKEISSNIKQCKFSLEQRLSLSESLVQQYASCGMEPASGVSKLRSENAFSITTGHQLCLFGGPLFVFYKIASTISLARKLTKENPLFQFVPIFWMATEDHDFEEVSTLNVAGEKIKWVSGQLGGVGRMSVDGLVEAFSVLKNVLGSRIGEFNEIIEKALIQENVSDFYRVFLHGIFGTDELVIIDPDDRSLKCAFTEVALLELNGRSKSALDITNAELNNLGYHIQVKGREINLFWLESNSRNRIMREGEYFVIVGTEKKYTKKEFEQLVLDFPEKISPNVVLRPVYQQQILPNIVTVGGGGELAYWMQLNRVFQEFDVYYPMLQMRSSHTMLNEKWAKKWLNMGFDLSSLFLPSELLKNQFVARENSIDIDSEIQKIENAFNDISVKVVQFEKSLEAMVGAEKRKVEKQLDGLNKRLLKLLKIKNEDDMNRIDRVVQMVWPEGVLQERYNSIFDFLCSIEDVKDFVSGNDPTDNTMQIIIGNS